MQNYQRLKQIKTGYVPKKNIKHLYHRDLKQAYYRFIQILHNNNLDENQKKERLELLRDTFFKKKKKIDNNDH